MYDAGVTKASPKFVTRALSGHSALGLAAAALLYILTVSGTISVFNHELQRWEQPGAPEMASISPQAAERAALSMLATEETPTSHFFIQLPTDDLPRVVLTTDTRAVFTDGTGAIVAEEAHPWTQFVLDLHYYLHLPNTLGLTIVGTLGVLLVGLSISGFLSHPSIFRDAFAFRFSGSARVAQADLHNRLSVWTSPFHLSIALTGAVLGLATLVAFAVATLDHEGDTDAVFAPVFGEEPEENDEPAPLAGIAQALTSMQAKHPDIVANYVIMHEPKTKGQHLQVLGIHPQRLIFGDYYNFDHHGEFVQTVGMADGTIGQQMIASVYRLHFGSFGGLPVKIAYALFSVVLAYIIASGFTIYLLKRREKGTAAPRLEAAWTSCIWGTPAALSLALLGSVTGTIPAGALPALFWICLGLAVFIAVVSPKQERLGQWLRGSTGVILLVATLVHFSVHAENFTSPAATSTALVLIGIALTFLIPLVTFRWHQTDKPGRIGSFGT